MAKTFTGVVSSDKGDKTIVVTVLTHKTHPVYKKQYPSSKKFLVHDEANQAKVGDKVVFSETRPVSARKRHVLSRIVGQETLKHEEKEVEL